jgi:CheY-like chemotaxis protein
MREEKDPEPLTRRDNFQMAINTKEAIRDTLTAEQPGINFLCRMQWEGAVLSSSGPPPGSGEKPVPGRSQGSWFTGKKLKIIVADDEPLIALTVSEILEDEGFDVITVADGKAAVEAAREISPDLILTDVLMPKMNGIELGKTVRNFLPQCRIILISGQAATGDLLKRARDEGHEFEVVTKPIQPDALIALVRESKQ